MATPLHSAQILCADMKAVLDARAGGVRRIEAWAADTWSTKVQRKRVPGRGFGIIANVPIARGELVGASRALSVVYEDEVGKTVNDQLAHRLRATVLSECKESSNRLLQRIFSLCGTSQTGSYGIEPLSGDDAGQRLGLDANGYAWVPTDILMIIDRCGVANTIQVEHSRLLDMIHVNSDDTWCYSKDHSVDPCHPPGSRRPRVTGAAIFGEPSWMNHSFDANVVATVVCDVMFLRSSRSIAAGEELTRSYKTWGWDQKALDTALGRYGIDLESCLQESHRLISPMARQDPCWDTVTGMLSKVEVMLTKSGSSIDACERAARWAQQAGAGIFDSSPYLKFRLHMLFVEVLTRTRRLVDAFMNAEIAITLFSQCDPDGAEFGRYCAVLLLLCAGLHHNTLPACDAPVAYVGWNGAVEFLLRVVTDMAQIFLGPDLSSFCLWVREWFGSCGPMEPLLDLAIHQAAVPGTSPVDEVYAVSHHPAGHCDDEVPLDLYGMD